VSDDRFDRMEQADWDDAQEDRFDERETCILCGCIIGEEVGVGLRNPDGSGRAWCDVCYKPVQDAPSAKQEGTK
jgi:hypothetical protein